MSEFGNISEYKDEARRIGEQVADAFDDGFLNNLQKANSKVVKAFNTRYQAINYQLEFGLITEEEYYKKLEQARDRYFGRNTQEWYKYTAEIYEYRKKALEEYQEYVEENLNTLLETVEKGREEFARIQDEQGKYKGKLLDYAGSPTGFDTHTTYVDNYWPTGDPIKLVDYTLVDYDKEIEKLKSFNDSINQLKERAQDIDPEVFSVFFDELRGMSIDDAKILTDLLLKAGDEDFVKHFQLYQERNELAENMSISHFGDDFKNLEDEIRLELQHQFVNLPSDFFKYGTILGAQVTEGFISEVNDFFSDITVEIPVIEAATETTNNIQNSTFSPVYYVYGDRATTSRTRLVAKNESIFDYMRGIE